MAPTVPWGTTQALLVPLCWPAPSRTTPTLESGSGQEEQKGQQHSRREAVMGGGWGLPSQTRRGSCARSLLKEGHADTPSVDAVHLGTGGGGFSLSLSGSPARETVISPWGHGEGQGAARRDGPAGMGAARNERGQAPHSEALPDLPGPSLYSLSPTPTPEQPPAPQNRLWCLTHLSGTHRESTAYAAFREC